MFSFSNLLLGVIGLCSGSWITIQAYYLNHHIYFMAWAENKWGPGSGTLAYRWIGVAVIIFSVFVITGKINLFSSPYEVNNPGSKQIQVQVLPSGGSDTRIAP